MGLVQGITEFLPVSSSGHLSVLQNLFGMENIERVTSFDVLLNLATLVSICIVYWQDIKDMVTEFFGFFRDLRHPKPGRATPSRPAWMVFMIIIALAPLLVAYHFLDISKAILQHAFYRFSLSRDRRNSLCGRPYENRT
jgi:undecaprenyl-diphosphatase